MSVCLLGWREKSTLPACPWRFRFVLARPQGRAHKAVFVTRVFVFLRAWQKNKRDAPTRKERREQKARQEGWERGKGNGKEAKQKMRRRGKTTGGDAGGAQNNENKRKTPMGKRGRPQELRFE